MEKLKILVIDDEKDFADLVAEQLELDGYEVFKAHDGEEGLLKTRTYNPDLIICDVRMPKKTGFEVLRELKKSGIRIPFIMLTAVDDFEMIKEAYVGEVDFYITKPVRLEKLIKNVRIVLNLARSRVDS